MSTRVAVGPVALSRRTVRWLGVLVAVEVLALGAYVWLGEVSVFAPRYLLYPFVWINASALAVAHTRRPQRSTVVRHWRLAGLAVAGGYLLVLAVVGGVVGAGVGTGGHHHASGFRVVWAAPPGWGPAAYYRGELLQLRLLPYQVLGYLGLVYLAYATVLDASRAALGGLVGVASCVSCTLPVATALLSGALGGSVAVASATWAYDLSTLAFVVAVAILSWRPDHATG